jgi:hypothetical protein
MTRAAKAGLHSLRVDDVVETVSKPQFEGRLASVHSDLVAVTFGRSPVQGSPSNVRSPGEYVRKSWSVRREGHKTRVILFDRIGTLGYGTKRYQEMSCLPHEIGSCHDVSSHPVVRRGNRWLPLRL